MTKRGGELSGRLWNDLEDELYRWATDTLDWLTDEFMASGYPPGGEPRTARAHYDALVAAKVAGDPAFFDSPAAQANLARLELQFGPAARPVPNPFEGVIF